MQLRLPGGYSLQYRIMRCTDIVYFERHLDTYSVGLRPWLLFSYHSMDLHASEIYVIPTEI